MADYHPLIARAVAGLEKNTGENRRALYERARAALVAQLRGVVPALDESEITRERLALEEAIRKVEAEAARNARESSAAQHHQARRAAATARRRAASAAPAGRVEYTPDREFSDRVLARGCGGAAATARTLEPADAAGRGAQRVP